MDIAISCSSLIICGAASRPSFENYRGLTLDRDFALPASEITSSLTMSMSLSLGDADTYHALTGRRHAWRRSHAFLFRFHAYIQITRAPSGIFIFIRLSSSTNSRSLRKIVLKRNYAYSKDRSVLNLTWKPSFLITRRCRCCLKYRKGIVNISAIS